MVKWHAILTESNPWLSSIPNQASRSKRNSCCSDLKKLALNRELADDEASEARSQLALQVVISTA